MRHWHERITLAVTILAGCLFFLYWIFHDPVGNFNEYRPGMDNRPAGSANSGDSVVIGEKFNTYDSTFVTTLEGKWPNFRGSNHDNISREKIRLIDRFPAGGPRILWNKMLGEGHAAAAIYNGRVYILDYDERKKSDALHCYSLVDGTELWRRSYRVNLKRNHGMSRTIPAVNDKYVVTIGPRCHVMCCDALTGKLVWGIDLAKEYRTTVPLWYTGQCPLIDNNIAVIAPGGKALLMGIDCSTGKVVWQTPNPDSLKMSHSSVVPMTLAGRKMYVYNAVGGLCGISAEGPDRGTLLWKTKEFSPSVIAPSPVYVGQNRIFVTAGYGAGSALFSVSGDGSSFSARMIQIFKPSEGMASEQQTPIFAEGHVFNIQTKDAGPSRNEFVCCLPDDFKKIKWTSGTTDRFGLGPYMIADNKFFILNDEGVLTIARFSTKGFEVLDRAKVIEGQDSWGPLAIADGFLVLRDSKQMICIDLRSN
ncbi:MAG: PQQ-binding-like beta-propeller repeat protein [Bacteroidales bacterium]